MRRLEDSSARIIDAIVVVILCFGWFILGSIGAVASGFPTGQFSDSEFFGIVLSEFVLGTMALAFLYFRGHSLAPLVPTPTALGCLGGLALYAAAVAATWPLGLVIAPQELAAQPIEQMARGATISLPALIGLSIVNGAYEETFLVGYLLPALEPFGASFAIGASLLVRVLYHLYQGPIGAISVLVGGGHFQRLLLASAKALASRFRTHVYRLRGLCPVQSPNTAFNPTRLDVISSSGHPCWARGLTLR